MERMGGLENNIEISSALGTFVGEFATVEMLIAALVGRAIDEKPSELHLAWAICGRIQSIPARCDAAVAIVERSKMTAEDKIEAHHFLDFVKEINIKRNQYVHAAYSTNMATKAVTFSPFATQTGRKTRGGRVITAVEIWQDIHQIRKVNTELMRKVFEISSVEN